MVGLMDGVTDSHLWNTHFACSKVQHNESDSRQFRFTCSEFRAHFIDPHAADWYRARGLVIPECVTQRVLPVNDERMTRAFDRGGRKHVKVRGGRHVVLGIIEIRIY